MAKKLGVAIVSLIIAVLSCFFIGCEIGGLVNPGGGGGNNQCENGHSLYYHVINYDFIAEFPVTKDNFPELYEDLQDKNDEALREWHGALCQNCEYYTYEKHNYVYDQESTESYRQEEIDGYIGKGWTKQYHKVKCSKCNIETIDQEHTGDNCTVCGYETVYFVYEKNDDESYTAVVQPGVKGDVVVPDTYNNLPVTNVDFIYEEAGEPVYYEMDSLTLGTNITLESMQKNWNNLSFRSKTLKKLTINGSAELMNLEIPNVEEINAPNSFASYLMANTAKNLKKIVIGYLDDYAFANVLLDNYPESCEVTINSTYGEDTKYINAPKFATKVILGENVKHIDKRQSSTLGSAKIDKLETVEAPYLESIGEFAFCGQYAPNLVTFNAPKLTKIGGHAFADDGKLVNFTCSNELVEIGTCAFTYTGLKSFSIPNTVTVLGSLIFYGCPNFESLYYNVPQAPEDAGCIMGSTGYKVENGVSVTIGKDVLVVHEYAFNSGDDRCKITKVEFEEGCKATTIEPYAFSNCSFAEITLPDTVVTVGEFAFIGNVNLTTINASANTNIPYTAIQYCNNYKLEEVGGGKYFRNKLVGIENNTINLEIKAGTTAIETDLSYENRLTLKTVTMPDSITKIPDQYFYNSVVETVKLSNGLTEISESMFSDCYNLTSVTLPTGLKVLPINCFRYCTELQTITLPSGLTEIKNFAFINCTKLENIVIPNTVTKMGEAVFEYCEKLSNVTLSNTLTEIPTETFASCTKLETLTIPASVTKINAKAFLESGLLNVVIPDSVTEIANNAFEGSKLTQITLSANLTVLGNRAFYKCLGLLEITIPNKLTKLDVNTFYGCTSLKTVTLGTELTTISNNCFYGCTSLDTINFNQKLSEIQNYAFYNCKFAEIVFPDSVKKIGPNAFKDNTLLVNVTYHKDCVVDETAFAGCNLKGSLYQNAFYLGTTLTAVRDNTKFVYIKEGTTTIKDGAFDHYSGRYIYVPSTVTEYESDVFSNCTNTKLVLEKSGYLSNCGMATSNMIRNVNVTEEGFAYDGEEIKGYYGDERYITIPSEIDGTAITVIGVSPGSYDSGNSIVGSGAFEGNTLIEDVTLPVGIFAIQSQAFKGCTNLKTITIPAGCVTIAARAFAGCTSLTTVKFTSVPSTGMPEYDAMYGNEYYVFAQSVVDNAQTFPSASQAKATISLQSINIVTLLTSTYKEDVLMSKGVIDMYAQMQ